MAVEFPLVVQESFPVILIMFSQYLNGFPSTTLYLWLEGISFQCLNDFDGVGPGWISVNFLESMFFKRIPLSAES